MNYIKDNDDQINLLFMGEIMKRLFLCRHCHAGESDKGDFYRELNRAGRLEAECLAARLSGKKLRADLIFSSPALRALQTATAIANALEYETDRIFTDMSIYDQDDRAMLSLLRHTGGEAKNVWIFGHNPSLKELAAMLTGLPEHKTPPGTVVAVEFDITDWADIFSVTGNLFFREIP